MLVVSCEYPPQATEEDHGAHPIKGGGNCCAHLRSGDGAVKREENMRKYELLVGALVCMLSATCAAYAGVELHGPADSPFAGTGSARNILGRNLPTLDARDPWNEAARVRNRFHFTRPGEPRNGGLFSPYVCYH
jgi:hypothetical protein